MKTTQLMLAALLAGMSAAALAEDEPPHAQSFRFDSLAMDQRSGVTVMRTNSTRGAPYSALAVTERTQALADGNQIAERQGTMTYRDGAGRTRREVRDAKGETVLVTINDPVGHATMVLRPRTRTATRIGDLGLAARADVEKARLAAETAATEADAARVSVVQARRNGDLPNVERRRFEDGSEAIIVKRVERSDGEALRRVQDVRIQFPQALANAVAERAGQATALTLTNGMFADAKWAAKATTKDLGTREIGGIKAEGKLRSYEIPAGEIGNSRAIVVADETWTSPELKVAVYTKHSDPRSGEVVFRLENIRREEPAAALFGVPADYTVQESPQRPNDKGR